VLPGRWVSSDVRFQPGLAHGRRFVIRVEQVSAHVTACTVGGGTLDIEGWSSHPLASGAAVLITPRKSGRPAVRVAAEPAPAPGQGQPSRPRQVGRPRGSHPFRARIPVEALISHLDLISPIDRIIHVHDEFTWDVSLSAGEGSTTTTPSIDPATTGARVAETSREVTAIATPFGSLSLVERTVRPVVTGVEWPGDGRLVLRGDYSGQQDRPAALILRHVKSGRQYILPLRWEGSTFTTGFAPAAATGPAGPGGSVPLADGDWHMLAPPGTGGAEVAVALDRQLLPRLPGYHRMGLHEVAVRPYNADALRFHARLACADNERGPYAVQHLATQFYPIAHAEPLHELAVFDCFGGRDYSCNPRAIHDELRRTHPAIECAWVTSDLQFSVPEGTRLIPADSRAHFEALARARYVIVNDELPRWFRRREGQTCLQTWHGSPLKRIGLDIPHPRFGNWLTQPDLLRQAAANWSLLLSQNAFSTAIFRHAFGYEGEIAETGYPRNDALHHPDREHHAAAIRDRLGLPGDRRVVLYAPTWREAADPASGGGYAFDLRLDLPAMADALGDHYVLFLRVHPNASPTTRSASGFVAPVASSQDITDLLLISDVLITDYSSVMFDFASIGRPILFYTYDLDSYRDLHGFYFDLQAQAPGPLLRTTQDVIDALRALPSIQHTYQDAYEAFARTYCALDDGKAAARAVQRLTSQ
jgi:CDP-glycerol glycerophosphotransferase